MTAELKLRRCPLQGPRMADERSHVATAHIDALA